MINWNTISLKDLAGFLCEELGKRGIKAVLVGEACVTIYSENRYQSYDLDYITYEDMTKVKRALTELDFNEQHKYFQHDDCPWMVEFVSPPVAVGNETIQTFADIKTSLGTITCLLPIDSVKDRLANFYHWSDKQSLEQAVDICMECEVDLDEVRKWSIKEKQEKKFQIFIDYLKKKKP